MANLLSKFFGRTASEGAAFALGLATGPVLYPAVREIEQEANTIYPTAAVQPGDAAEIVAESVELHQWGAGEALMHGVNSDRFDALVGAVLNAPGFAELLQLKRRGLITAAEFSHGLRKARLETLWDDGLAGLENVLLTVADLANAVVQGHMDQGAAAAEALLQGVSNARFDVLVQNTGLPPGPETLEAWWRRGIITTAEFEQGIREGHTKTKYIPFYEAARAPLLSAATAVRLYLKGWYTKGQRDALGAEWGYSSQQMEDWFLSEGRPATARQIHIGYARGATLPGAANEVDAIRTSVKQSDIRPEYADIIVAGRYSYPSAFVLRSLVQSGAVSRDEAHTVLLYEGWEPTFAATVADAWAATATGGATANPNVAKAQTQLWTATHRSYVTGTVDKAQAETALAKIVPDAPSRAEVLATWDAEKEIAVKALTPAQVKSAYTNAIITLDTALAELARLGYDSESAARLLGTVSQAPTISQIMAETEASVRAGTVDTVEAIAQLRAAGLTTQNAAALVNTWQGGTAAA